LVQVIDRSAPAAGPDLELLSKLARLGLGTPLIYSGGIRSVTDGGRVIQSGADRIVVDALLHDDLPALGGLCDKLGAQALIAATPLVLQAGDVRLVNYRSKSVMGFDALAGAVADGMLSEILAIDMKHEGVPGAFDGALVDRFPFREVPLIAFGGISTAGQIQSLLARPNVAAVGIGNFLNYREHAVQSLKTSLASAALRPPAYAAETSLLADA
jgi:imidazole glycerol-phosphate synthase subunit HisF